MKKNEMPNMGVFIDKVLDAFFFESSDDGELQAFHMSFNNGYSIVITRDGDSFKIERYLG